ncbi:MAG: putative bifunctional diguanylate cyclase/phosphodiesterase [Rhodanobacter sp.]
MNRTVAGRRPHRGITGDRLTLYITSLLIACGICFFAGIHAMFAGSAAGQDRVYLAFGCLSLLLSIYLALTAALYQTTTLSTAVALVRAQICFSCLIYPTGIWFFSLYAGLVHWRRWLTIAASIFGVLLVINLGSPYSLLYTDIIARAPLVLPWGETVHDFAGTEASLLTGIYYTAVDASYLWAVCCCIMLWRRGSGARVWSLTLYLIVQAAASVHAETVNLAGGQGLTFDSLAFLVLVLLMSGVLRRELQRRTQALASSLDELRSETLRREGVEADLRHLAYHDQLTGLPNRHYMHERLHAALGSAEPVAGALILFDLDHFKTINEALGHDVGDELLKGVAARISEAAPVGACLARFGGDEFALHLPSLTGTDAAPAQAALRIAREITTQLTAPLRIGNHDLVVGVSAGIAPLPGAARDVDSVLRQVDMALYRAKAAGRHTAVVFESGMQAQADRRLLLEKGLRLALERGEFELHYQPQVDMQARFIGAEALLRWRHPEHGLIDPAEFIPIAEETGLIHRIGRHVLHQACLELDNWPAAHAQARLSINVSPWQLFTQDFVRTLQETVASTRADPRRITLEITENTFLHDLDDVARKIRALEAAGFRFSLDDFGSGYTSLASLKKLPVRELKIDRTFIEGLHSGPHDHFIEAMITMAHHLKLFVIAEGVETREQRAVLAGLDCDAIQGYLISHPLPTAAFRHWLTEHTGRCADNA